MDALRKKKHLINNKTNNIMVILFEDNLMTFFRNTMEIDGWKISSWLITFVSIYVREIEGLFS